MPLLARVAAMAGVLLIWVVSISSVPVLGALELILYDLRFRLREPFPPTPDVVLAVVDEDSLRRLGRWPWPRSTLADLVRHLDADGARVIAFEMAFLEPDSLVAEGFVRDLEETLDRHGVRHPALRQEVEALELAVDTDAALARAIEGARAPVVLSYIFQEDPSELVVPLEPAELAARVARIRSARYQVSKLPGGADRPPVPSMVAPLPSVEVLARATPYAGFLQIKTDPDGGVRRATMVLEHGGDYYPSLAVQAVWNALGRPFPLGIYGGPFEVEQIQLGKGRSYFTSERGEFLINYVGPPGVFPRHSIASILGGELPAGTFRDKIVLVGTYAKGVTRELQTPMDSFHPGVEIQATILDNLLERRILERPDWFDFVDLLAILLAGGLAALALGRHGVVLEFFALLAASAVYLAGNFVLFHHLGVAVTTIYPPLAMALVYGVLTLVRYLEERDERRRIEGAFGRYVAPRVIQQMLGDPDQLKLGGEERQITVLFSDVEGFTAVSEKLPPKEMLVLMSEYFEEMTARIHEEDGLLKEYVGDEIMAMFGAPLTQEDHAARACRAALRMRRRLEELCARWVEEGRPPLNARWGVNSGNVLVGNLGSSYRYSYGALGDNVNLGSRLEGLNSQYGTRILIGENTRELVGDAFPLREVDTVAVKGKGKSVRVFELLGEPGEELAAPRGEAYARYAEGLAAYRAGSWDAARGHFAAVLELLPEDGPAAVLMARCEDLLASPPEGEWTGVYTATRK